MAGARKSAGTLDLFEVRFLCGGEAGVRQVWAPTGADASRLVRDRASLFGLPHETVLVTRVVALEVRDAA